MDETSVKQWKSHLAEDMRSMIVRNSDFKLDEIEFHYIEIHLGEIGHVVFSARGKQHEMTFEFSEKTEKVEMRERMAF